MPAVTEPTVVVATHGHCFDGLASAVVFTWLYRALRPQAPSSFAYRACDYGPGDSAVPASWLTGQDNAILDFRYAALPQVTWYFDHHGTAFRTPDDQAHFEARPAGQRFYDPAYSSCTKLIADTARSRFGLEPGGLDELVRWADIIDAARFPTAEMAVARVEAEMHLMTVIEHDGGDELLAELVPRLLVEPLSEVARSAAVEARFKPLEKKRERSIQRMRKRAELRGPVAYCDLADEHTEVTEKFALYWLFPQTTYSLVLSRTFSRLKVSIGFNPWSQQPRRHHIGEMCRRHGGGGHPVVGGINFPYDELDRVRALCAQLAEELGR